MFVTIYLGVGFVVGTLSYSLGVYGILEDARAFDAIQFLFGILFATNWGMVRYEFNKNKMSVFTCQFSKIKKLWLMLTLNNFL